MKATAMLWPMAAQILLTLFLFLPLAGRKRRAVAAGRVDLDRAALDNSAWPEDVVRLSNNIQNQFQLPVLFYAVCLALALLDAAGWPAVLLAWLFVATRIAHSWIHVTTNHVPHRMRIFIAGYGCLLALWLLLAFALLVA